jgi:hypothetical protein
MPLRANALTWLPRMIDSLFGFVEIKHIQKKLLARRSNFARPAMVLLESEQPLFAWTRDISRNGIGLLHERELPQGKLQIKIDLGDGRCVQIRARLVWCHQTDQKSYISGAEFLTVPSVIGSAIRFDNQVMRSAVA